MDPRRDVIPTRASGAVLVLLSSLTMVVLGVLLTLTVFLAPAGLAFLAIYVPPMRWSRRRLKGSLESPTAGQVRVLLTVASVQAAIGAIYLVWGFDDLFDDAAENWATLGAGLQFAAFTGGALLLRRPKPFV